MQMKHCPIESRPYEKFETKGAKSLSDSELLAILLRTGTKDKSVVELAGQLLDRQPTQDDTQSRLLNLFQHTLESLQNIKGIGKIKAIQILSLLELSKRLAEQRYTKGEPLTDPKKVALLFMERLRHEKKEYFMTVYLDAKCRMIGIEQVSIGSLTAAVVHPREVYKGAINQSAHSIIALHNHPSGDTTPSREDIYLTKRLKETGEIIGITLVDHIILGDGTYKSLKEEGYL